MSDEKTCEDCCCYIPRNEELHESAFCQYYDLNIYRRDAACSMYEQLNNPNFGKE